MESFEEALSISARIHGHILCRAGYRCTNVMLGLQKIAISDPKGKDRKKLYIVVEIDRYATDAIQSVTGCSLGKRSLRWMDYRIMAATFVNLETGRSVRLTAREEARQRAKTLCPEIRDKYKQQLQAYLIMPEEELFKIEEVEVSIPYGCRQ